MARLREEEEERLRIELEEEVSIFANPFSCVTLSKLEYIGCVSEGVCQRGE